MLFLHSFYLILPSCKPEQLLQKKTQVNPLPRVKTKATLQSNTGPTRVSTGNNTKGELQMLARVLHGVNLGPQPQTTHENKCNIHVDKVCVPV